ncbi:hypothetical protein F5880DRAFT_1625565 [Lentinula raphanica]|nr:hypothetical protein F5880DRAFT_1625565 [Lentinula raphanica]
MVGRAKSETLKAREIKHIPGTTLDKKPLSYQKCCDEITAQFQQETGKLPPKPLSTTTLDRLYKGGIPKSVSNASRGWLTNAESAMVIRYALEMAKRGFPLTHELLKVEVDSICRARLGEAFPAGGWTHRFIEKYHKQLKMHWASSLDEKRGRAVNPTTNEQWFDLLEDVLAGNRDYEFDLPCMASSNDSNQEISVEGPDEEDDEIEIDQSDIYGQDESGFQSIQSSKQRVIGARLTKIQHQQSDGGRENTTVMVTICADGTSLREPEYDELGNDGDDGEEDEDED